MQMMRSTRRSLAVTLVTAMLATPVLSYAQSCDPDTEARLQFLETRLEDGQRSAQIWWWSWMTVFGVGAVASTVSAVLHDDQSNQANSGILAGKSLIGVLDLSLRPHVARHGADRVRAVPKTSSEACAQRLALAEKTMAQSAKEGSMRWNWKRHLWSLTLNLAHGLVIAEAWHDEGTGWKSFAVSETSAELHLWTHPTRARNDWAEYQSEFSGAPAARARSSWNFAAQPGGVGVVWHF
jgi:hypothetical protein